MKSERVEILVCGFECCIFYAKKSWVEISLEKWNVFVTDEFSCETLVLWRDGPVCTRSASCFCRNPLNFCTHVMWVKWWYHAKFQPFLSSGYSPFQFQGHLAENKSWNAWKISNEVKKGWNFSMWIWMLHVLDAKKVLSWNKLRKMKCLCNSEFSSETLVLWKRWSSLDTKCIQFLP